MASMKIMPGDLYINYTIDHPVPQLFYAQIVVGHPYFLVILGCIPVRIPGHLVVQEVVDELFLFPDLCVVKLVPSTVAKPRLQCLGKVWVSILYSMDYVE